MAYNEVRSIIRPDGLPYTGRRKKIDLFTTMFNISSHEIWCKPEAGSNTPYKVDSFDVNLSGFDGFTHPKYPGMVYKVKDKFSILLRTSMPKIYIFNDGFFWGANKTLNELIGGGWKTQDWFHEQNDFNWDELFSKS